MAKLSGSGRAKLPGKVFAGPGRSFPVEDKAHAGAALRLVGSPKPSPVVRDKAQIEAKYQITEQDVDDCKAWLDQTSWPDMVKKGFLKHMDADVVADAWCPNCNGRVKVRYPNYAGFKNVVQLASEYLMRKMADVTEVHVSGRVVHELESLSSEELAEIAEGVWVPQLPPAV